MSTDTQNAATQVGKQLVDLCRQGGFMEALNTLYADDIESVEAVDMPGMDRVMKGIEAIKGKNQWWSENHEVHSIKIEGPFPHGDRFGVVFDMEVTPKHTGQRTKMSEMGLYTVRNGKIAKEEFFYEA